MINKGTEFTARRDAIRMLASQIYRAEMDGAGVEDAENGARMLPLNLGASSSEIQAAKREDARVIVAGRVIARQAIVLDKVESASNTVSRNLFKLESFLSNLVNRTYLRDELGSDGLVAQIRGNTPAAPLRPQLPQSDSVFDKE